MKFFVHEGTVSYSIQRIYLWWPAAIGCVHDICLKVWPTEEAPAAHVCWWPTAIGCVQVTDSQWHLFIDVADWRSPCSACLWWPAVIGCVQLTDSQLHLFIGVAYRRSPCCAMRMPVVACCYWLCPTNWLPLTSVYTVGVAYWRSPCSACPWVACSRRPRSSSPGSWRTRWWRPMPR